MNGTLSIPQINEQLIKATGELVSYCRSLSDEHFFYQPPGKWSPAQQVKHLIKATDTARLAFTLPRFLVRLAGGTPNRNSRSFEELVAKYKLKLEQGGRASGRYVPKTIPSSYGKDKLVLEFEKAMKIFAIAVEKKWQDNQLDKFLAPHPLLGKITLRELCYFTIHHTHHHLTTIKELVSNLRS